MRMSARRAMLASVIIGASVALAAALNLGVGDASPPATTVSGGGNFQLQTSPETIFCADTVEGASTAVSISQCSAAASQRFTFSNGADGHNLILDSNGRCLGVGAKIDRDSRAVTDGPCNYHAKQRWSFLADGQIVTGNKILCLAPAGRVGAGAQVRLLTCDGSTIQHWKLSQ